MRPRPVAWRWVVPAGDAFEDVNDSPSRTALETWEDPGRRRPDRPRTEETAGRRTEAPPRGRDPPGRGVVADFRSCGAAGKRKIDPPGLRSATAPCRRILCGASAAPTGLVGKLRIACPTGPALFGLFEFQGALIRTFIENPSSGRTWRLRISLSSVGRLAHGRQSPLAAPASLRPRPAWPGHALKTGLRGRNCGARSGARRDAPRLGSRAPKKGAETGAEPVARQSLPHAALLQGCTGPGAVKGLRPDPPGGLTAPDPVRKGAPRSGWG
jgi:hypothetical protein